MIQDPDMEECINKSKLRNMLRKNEMLDTQEIRAKLQRNNEIKQTPSTMATELEEQQSCARMAQHDKRLHKLSLPIPQTN